MTGSATKQSIYPRDDRWIASAFALRASADSQPGAACTASVDGSLRSQQSGNIRDHSRDRFLPGVCIFVSPLSSRGRREGRAPAGTRRSRTPERTGIPRAEAHGQELQVQPRHPGLPRAMALRLIRTLPGERRCLSPLPAPRSAEPDRRHGRGARTTRFRRTLRRFRLHDCSH
jgi:hypothetical protein